MIAPRSSEREPQDRAGRRMEDRFFQRRRCWWPPSRPACSGNDLFVVPTNGSNQYLSQFVGDRRHVGLVHARTVGAKNVNDANVRSCDASPAVIF